MLNVTYPCKSKIRLLRSNSITNYFIKLSIENGYSQAKSADVKEIKNTKTKAIKAKAIE
jgi:hypothetical protein